MASRPGVVVSKRRGTLDAVHTVVALKGELDSAALNLLVDAFDAAVGRDDTDVIVDLAEVDFIGAAWLGTIVKSRAVLRAQHRNLMLRAPSDVARRLLDLCGLEYLVEPVEIAPG
ncbi:MAG TPA: STAS domain-containing protein [Acidimicrobiia bacterium]|nr:STAS domain-containing protein [Acidimicrobiia bacterium]